MKRHYYWLDLLRFLAAFQVLAFHYRGAFFVEYRLLPATQQNLLTSILFFFTRLGEQSVLIFFVLSGFLVGGKSLERIIHNKVDIKSYIIDRFVRIMLPLTASVVLVILIDLFIGHQIPWIHLLGSLFSLQGIFTNWYTNGPLWSLSYEVWFYVLMGCIMVIFRAQNKRFFVFSILILTLVILIFTTKLSPIFLLIWLLGASTYLLPPPLKSSSKKKILILGCLVLSGMVLTVIAYPSRSVTLRFSLLNRNMANIFLAFTTCIFIHNIIRCVPQNKLAIKIDKIGSKLSKFSYSLYLTHFPLISLFRFLGFPQSPSINFKSVSLYLFEIFIALVTGYIFFLVFEKHTIKVKRFLKNRKRKRPIISGKYEYYERFTNESS